MNKKIVLMTVLIFGLVAVLASCASMQVKPTEANFKSPIITLDSVQLSYYEGFWYYGKAKVAMGKPPKGGGSSPVVLDFVFNIENPKISILGLNPHAGEGGNIGFEEMDIITPSIKSFKEFIKGPFVPDAYFGNQLYKKFDCTVGIYHDQILIPFKLLNFNKGVNFTAGLPIVRTSPDHGTAFDIAGEGTAEAGSMIEAYQFAQKMLKNRRANIAEG